MLNETILKMGEMLTDHHNKLNEALNGVLTMRINNEEVVKENVKLKKDIERMKDLMSSFSHGLNSCVDIVGYAAKYKTEPKMLIDLEKTMRGIIEITTVISYAPSKLIVKLQEDKEGERSFMHVVHKALWQVCIDFVARRNFEQMSRFYFNYARRQQLIPADTSFLSWHEEEAMRDIKTTIGNNWLFEMNKYGQPECLGDLLAWCKHNIMDIQVFGFDSVNCFSHAGVKESLLLVILKEMLFNAMKHYDTESTKPINLIWEADNATINCINPTSENARRQGAGNGRGLNFLALIATNVGGEFVPPSWDDSEVVTSFSFPENVFS